MGIKHSSQGRNILSILLLTIIFTLSWYTVNPGTSSPVADSDDDGNDKMADSADVISKLKVSVRQVSASPAKLAISVTNAHDGPVTVLSWNSPLDPLALQLGVVSFFEVPADGEDDDGGRNDGASPIQIPTIQIRRMMPPGPESLVTIGAGQTSEQELEIKGPPLEKLRGRRVAVVCKGEWTSVWLSEADAITKLSLENVGASEDAFGGSFQSEAVQIEL